MENEKRFEEMSKEEYKEHSARVLGGLKAEPYESRDLEKENKVVNIMGDKVEDNIGNDAELIKESNKEYNEKLDEEFKNETEGIKDFIKSKLNKLQWKPDISSGNGKEIFDFMSNLIRLDQKDHGKFLKFIKLPILNDTICREHEPTLKNNILDNMVDYLRENKIKSETETIFKIINLLDAGLYIYDSAKDENLKWLGLEREERSHIGKDWDERGADLKRNKKYGPIAPIVKKISNLGKK